MEHLNSTTSRPSILWLQLDNSYCENKNHVVFGFLAWLVSQQIFSEVMVSYLMVGHTHNKLDQVFSTSAIYQNTHSIFSFKHLIQLLGLAYKKAGTTPSGAFLPTVFNWEGFVCSFVKLMSGISTPHVFLFKNLDEGTVGMKVKAWHSTDDPWIGGTDETEEWWTIMSETPEGFPPQLQPALLENYPDPRTLSMMEDYMN